MTLPTPQWTSHCSCLEHCFLFDQGQTQREKQKQNKRGCQYSFSCSVTHFQNEKNLNMIDTPRKQKLLLYQGKRGNISASKGLNLQEFLPQQAPPPLSSVVCQLG